MGIPGAITSSIKFVKKVVNASPDAQDQSYTCDADGDGKQVKATVGGVTTVYVVEYYEWTSAGNTKYYFADGQRAAMSRTGQEQPSPPQPASPKSQERRAHVRDSGCSIQMCYPTSGF